MYQEPYLPYNNALTLGNMKNLKTRRLNAIMAFSKEALFSEKYKNWFFKNTEINTSTRWKPKASLKPINCTVQTWTWPDSLIIRPSPLQECPS